MTLQRCLEKQHGKNIHLLEQNPKELYLPLKVEMDEHAKQVPGQWGVCVGETYTCWPFERFSKHLWNDIYLCLIAPVLRGVLPCISFPARRSCRCGDPAPGRTGRLLRRGFVKGMS